MRTAVVGAGIAGLAAAREITKAGGEAVVFEAADYIGGRIKTVRHHGFQFDVGAFIYLGSYHQATDMMREVGLTKQMTKVPAYGAMPRNGELHYLDLSKPVRTVGGTKYLSTANKIRLGKLIWQLARHWKDLNYIDASGVAQIDTDTVESWCRRELNQDLLDYIGAVVVRGPWLSDPSYASYGQLLWTLKNFFVPYFYGLDGGMDALPRAMAAGINMRLSTPVRHVADTGGGVEIETDSGTELFDNAVITATTAKALEIYPQLDGFAREYYEQTNYICSVNTHIALSCKPANPATYIMCSPREQPDMCGVIVDHFKAGNRVPEGKGMITVFCRHEWCLEYLEAPEEEILEQVLRFVAPYYGDLSDAVEHVEIGRWREVVPIMKKGRFKAVDRFMKSVDPDARVQLAGDLGPIPGVNGALVSGTMAGRRLAAQKKVGKVTLDGC
ncbi:protoporphyrinogen/coproporphyrinogen oxidase [Nocardia sp. NPDC059246]|uniref:protoporphyrinogen/coproporphyrinogen oxidase n=1 Tax=unclassified Nocardia TaxID=2637762 RepID=UPI0036980FBA